MLKRFVHPGEILRDELAEFGVSPTAFARQIDVPPNRVSRIIAGKRSVTGDTAEEALRIRDEVAFFQAVQSVLAKRILRRHGYPPDKQEKATRTVLEQAEVLSEGWAVAGGPPNL